MKHITDKIALEWAERQGLYGIPTMTLRCAISDARSIPELATAEQPSCGQDARDATRYREALESICQYGSDTLSGNAKGPTDREWFREGVKEMRNRALAAIAAQQRQGGGA